MENTLTYLLNDFETFLTTKGVSLEKWTKLKQEIQKKLTSSNFPKMGDKVFAKYFQYQYFPATIDSYDTAAQKFHISWDDNDSEGRIVAVADVALNRIPDLDQIGLGSHVLFQQGSYGAADDRSGGYRWHMGKITNIRQDTNKGFLFDGEHVYGEGDGKWVTYRGFEQTFSGLTLDQLRVSPNILDSFDNEEISETTTADLDIFVCYSDRNTKTGNKATNIDPMRVICDIESRFGLKSNLKVRNPSTIQVVGMIQKAKLFLAFISNEFATDEKCQQQFQYAKKSRGCPVIPVVVGNDFEWTKTVVGLLIAGELYIHFRDEAVYEAKLRELQGSMNRILDPVSSTQSEEIAEKPCHGFISYCWTNSFSSKEANQIGRLVGNQFSDPRRIKYDLESRLAPGDDTKLWLDIEKIGTSNLGDLNATIFEQIAKGLSEAKVFLSFVSSEYSRSENCEMEFCHAVKTMGIPLIPIIVGEETSEDWKLMQVGMIVGANEAKNSYSARVDFRGLTDESEYNSKLDEIAKRIQKILQSRQAVKPQVKLESRAPKIGDHVVSHWQSGQFFFSTIVSFDKTTMCFTVDWDDGDTTGRVVKYNEVAKDVEVNETDVGVNTKVLFQQGRYKLNSEDADYSGYRYFEGVITGIKDHGAEKLYSGHHARFDRQNVPRFRGVSYEFQDLKIDQLRLAPTAFDVLAE